MVYLIDKGFRVNNALNILVNQCKYPGIYNECFCLGCNVNVNDNRGTCFAGDLRSSFANNVNDSVKDLRSSFANQGTCSADNDNVNDSDKDTDNDNDNVIILRSSFADNVIYQFDEKHGEKWQAKPHQKGKPNTISVNINEDLQSWLNDDNMITEATLPENFRCIISGPSKCGKTFLLKN